MSQLAPIADNSTRSPAESLPAGPQPSRKRVLVAFAIIAAIYLISVVGLWYHTPDSALYLSLARSLVRGEGYQFNGSTCTSVPPGMPLILAGLSGPGGVSYWAANAFVVVCALVTFGLIFLVLTRLYDKRTALLSVLVVAASYRFYQASHRILSDIPATLAIWLILYAGLRFRSGRAWWLAVAAASTAVAIFLRIPAAIIAGPVAMGLAFDMPQRKQRARRWLGAAVIVICIISAYGAWVLWTSSQPGATASYTNIAVTEKTSGEYWLRQLVESGMNLPKSLAEMLTGQEMTWTVGAPCLLLAALGMVGSWRRGRRLVPATIVPWLAVSLLATGAWAYRERYMLPVLPLIVASAFEGVCCLVNWLRRHGLASKRVNVARVTITVMAVAFIAINAPRILNWAFIYTWSAHTGEYYKRIAHGKYAELLPAARAASESTPAGDCVGAMGLHTSVAHLLTDRVVVQTGKNLTQEHMTAEQAAELLDTGRVASMIVQLEETPNDFAAAFDAIARKRIQSGRWSKLFDGADYQVYGPAGP